MALEGFSSLAAEIRDDIHSERRTRFLKEHTVYDMYPEWGPARHWDTAAGPASTADGANLQAVQAGLDLRDNGGQRPDDN